MWEGNLVPGQCGCLSVVMGLCVEEIQSAGNGHVWIEKLVSVVMGMCGLRNLFQVMGYVWIVGRNLASMVWAYVLERNLVVVLCLQVMGLGNLCMRYVWMRTV
ncbi:hypothetical protein AVEN_161349-1 [Araneus ventricosus]|uniref:Transmembrane protein n=1 Tax=Araneus ventricosus TaxID=182803 RepID=A0A4Y2Q4W2_ARAVE|nr:hypothetical protein AVEN_161349-1 [Araneus ventricosus]